MSRNLHREAQVIRALKQLGTGRKAGDVAREVALYSISGLMGAPPLRIFSRLGRPQC
jgi:hypothetical protein